MTNPAAWYYFLVHNIQNRKEAYRTARAVTNDLIELLKSLAIDAKPAEESHLGISVRALQTADDHIADADYQRR